MRFDGARSLAFGSRIVSWRWEFHDGSSAGEARAEKVYDRPGTYVAALRVEDERGSRDVDFCEVRVYSRDKVEPVMPTLFLTCWPSRDVRVGQPVRFRGWPQGAEADAPRIDFGDGAAVEKYRPFSEAVHSFEKPGIHVVTATASSAGIPVMRKVKVIVSP